MPEDQGFNGDRWNKEASKLFAKMGWEKIGDSNIDVEGTDGHQHGLDSIFRYKDVSEFVWEGVFIEAKNYSKLSFKTSKLHDWVKSINQKMLETRRSDDLFRKFPKLSEDKVQLRNAILSIWIKDLNGDMEFRKDFVNAMQSVNLSHGRGSPGRINRMFVLENDSILKICSLIDSIKAYTTENHIEENRVNYWYPATKSSLAISSKTLTIQYAFSKFVLVKVRGAVGRVDNNLVLYFGSRNYDDYAILREALSLYQFIDNQVPLTIFNYQDDEEFRKIRSEVEKLFINSESEYPEVQFRTMTKYSGLPGWMQDETR